MTVLNFYKIKTKNKTILHTNVERWELLTRESPGASWEYCFWRGL